MKNIIKPFIIVLIISILFSEDKVSYQFENNAIQTQEAMSITADSEINTSQTLPKGGITIAEKIFNRSYSICQNTLDFVKAFGDEVIERMK